jgi:hypothetical protein
MVGISEVIQTLGAMIIFSLILLTANRMIQTNTLKEVESEAEGIAVELAQSIIEEAQTKPFDANTVNGNIPSQIPQGFSSAGPGSTGDRNDFDDYDGHTDSLDTELTDPGTFAFNVNVQVSYVSPPNYDMASGSKTVPTMFKKMVVTVTSDYLRNNNQDIRLSYLRRYYKRDN